MKKKWLYPLALLLLLVVAYVGTYAALRLNDTIMHFAPDEYDDPSGETGGHIVRMRSPSTRPVLSLIFGPGIWLERQAWNILAP